MFKIAYSKPNKRFVANQLKKKKNANTLNIFFVRSSNGSMLTKSHQEGMEQIGNLFQLPRESTRPETKYFTA